MLSFCCYNLQNKKCHDRHVFRINSTAFGLFRHDWDFCNFFLLYYSLYLRLVKMMRWTRIWRICLSWSLKSPMKGLHKDNILAAWYLYLLKANTDYRAAFFFLSDKWKIYLHNSFFALSLRMMISLKRLICV